MKATIGRAELPEEKMYAEHFKQMHYEKSDVTEILNEIGSCLEIRPGLLRPQDRFGKDIGGGLLLTPELDTLFEAATVRAKRTDRSVKFQNIETVLEYVDAFARKGSSI